MFGKPPEVVPDDLTAKQYHELGIWYLDENMLEQARVSLRKAMSMAPDTETAIQAKRLLDARVPRHEIPQEALDELRRAEPQVAIKPEDAKRTAEKLIKKYPDFEWPHRLLADCHMRAGNIDRCIQSLQSALSINPDCAPALLLMARALTIDMEYDEATRYLQRAQAAMPDNDELRALQRGLDFLIYLDQEDVSLS
ncbi:MAG TPA: tetratricopeptide repeat protein [Candidatus Obscuribacterales bacterium]